MHYTTMNRPKETTKDSHQAGPRPGQQAKAAAMPKAPRTGLKSLPVDHNDLTRRLQIVLAQQKAYAEKKRRARLEAESRKAEPGQKESRKTGNEECSSAHAKRDKSAGRDKVAKTSAVKEARDEVTDATTAESAKEPGEESEANAEASRPRPHEDADQYERTTTVAAPVDKKLSRKPSTKAAIDESAPKTKIERNTSKSKPSSIDQNRLKMARARSRREQAQANSKFQPPTILETSREADPNMSRLAQRHTYDSHYRSRAMDLDGADGRKRRSFGARTSSDLEHGLTAWQSNGYDESQRAKFDKDDYRVDWTQSDEVEGRDKVRAGSGPLRKSVSIWTLRGRLGSFNKHGKEEKQMSPTTEETISEHPLKSPKSGFFARFKRQ